MKNKRKILLLLIFFIGFIAFTYAVDPPPPVDGDPGGPASIGGSAPIGAGHWISILLSVAYGTYIYLKNILNLKLINHEK